LEFAYDDAVKKYTSGPRGAPGLGPGLAGKLDKRALGCSLDCLTGDGSLRPPDFLITGHVPSSVSTHPDVDLQLADPRGELVEG